MTIEERLGELGVTLPEPSVPIASYTMAVKDGDLLYLSGHICKSGGEIVAGRVGDDISVEKATDLARSVALDLLATIASHTGLDNVAQMVKLNGYIRSAPGFTGQPAVMNGASDLFVQIFGEVRGRHARSAVGVAELPGGAAVEIDAIVRVG